MQLFVHDWAVQEVDTQEPPLQALPIAVQSVHDDPHATLAFADAQPPSTQQVLQLLLLHGCDPESERGWPASVGGPASPGGAPESFSPPPLLDELDELLL